MKEKIISSTNLNVNRADVHHYYLNKTTFGTTPLIKDEMPNVGLTSCDYEYTYKKADSATQVIINNALLANLHGQVPIDKEFEVIVPSLKNSTLTTSQGEYKTQGKIDYENPGSSNLTFKNSDCTFIKKIVIVLLLIILI